MAKTLDFVLADVFTKTAFGGNQLAVFPSPGELSADTMQSIARELNLSETVFVSPPSEPGLTFSIRIFTPKSELPFAGHPTIGTALVLEAAGALQSARAWRQNPDGSIDIVLGEGVGPVPVKLTTGDGVRRAVLTSPRLPSRVANAPTGEIQAALLGLTPDALAGPPLPAGCYSAGVPFTIIPLKSRAALSEIQFDATVWTAHLKHSTAPHVVALYLAGPDARELDMRMFAPAMGILEDPATGAAAVALGGFLPGLRRLDDGPHRWFIRQGHDMGRPSEIDLDVDIKDGAPSAVRVGGSAVLVGRGSLDLS